MRHRYRLGALAMAVAAALVGAPASAAPLAFAPWIDGTTATEPQTQVQQIDPDTFVIRQSVRTNFEAPFLYLLFGQDRALLIDSGAGGLAIRPAIDAVIGQWLARHGRASIPLVVAHSHSHGDHVHGDAELAARPDTRVIGPAPADVARFFGVTNWPDAVATFDLGGRALSIIPTPGHEPAHIMVHDPRTRLLFSGDMLYAGRLYVPTDAFATFVASADRVAAFARAHPVAAVLGAHIEMTRTPGKDYPMQAAAHADEHPLELPASAVDRLQAAVHRMAGAPVIANEGDFIVTPAAAAAVMQSPARQALARGDLAAVRRHAAGMTATPAEARFLLGIADAGEGRVAAGLAHIEAAIALAPTAEHLAQQARLLIMLRRDGEARAAAQAAQALGPADALTFDTIGNIHARLGDHRAARACFEPAVARDPGNIEFRLNLALALGFLGETDLAAAQHEIILAQAPAHGRAHHALSGLARARPDANHIERLEAVLAKRPAADDALRIRYALAKEYEDIGDAPAAFAHLAAANAAHKARIGYDFAGDAAIFDAIEAGFGQPGFFTGASRVTDAPIFITGMPRTGTTLVDRILSAHPEVHSAGELQAMPLAIKQLARTGSRRVIDAETVAASGDADPDAMGRLYVERAEQHRLAAGGRFIDKLPANFLNIGHIARALPEASIVCLRRHPLDTIWSNYKNLFASTSAYYFYSYDLLDTARYYARFDRLMAFWDRLFPGRILQLSYEDLVADQEAASRRLYDHCGLGWTDAALDFHTQTAAVATPSAAQVRRPIYGDAVARWRRHAEALAPARVFLEAQGIAVD